jgi:hypothetical protein
MNRAPSEAAQALASRRRAWRGFLEFGEREITANRRQFGATFRRELRDRVGKKIIKLFFVPLRRSLRKSRGYRLYDLHAILGLDPAQRSRRHDPSLQSFLLLLAIFGIDLETRSTPAVSAPVGFPQSTHALWRAIRFCIRIVQVRLGEHPSRLPDREQWLCVLAAMTSEAYLEGWRYRQSNVPENVKNGKALVEYFHEDFAERWRNNYPGGKIKSKEDVKKTLENWLIPVLLVHTVIPGMKKDYIP